MKVLAKTGYYVQCGNKCFGPHTLAAAVSIGEALANLLGERVKIVCQGADGSPYHVATALPHRLLAR